MVNRSDIHKAMLEEQVAAIFRYYRGVVKTRWVLGSFETLIYDGKPVVTYSAVTDETNPKHTTLNIDVTVEDRIYTFYQNYNFGVPRDSGVKFQSNGNIDKDLIDMEYAISIATEHTAVQIAKHLGA